MKPSKLLVSFHAGSTKGIPRSLSIIFCCLCRYLPVKRKEAGPLADASSLPYAFLVLTVQINATRHPTPPTPVRPLTTTRFFNTSMGRYPTPASPPQKNSRILLRRVHPPAPVSRWRWLRLGARARLSRTKVSWAISSLTASSMASCTWIEEAELRAAEKPRRLRRRKESRRRNPAEELGKVMLAVETRKKQYKGMPKLHFGARKAC